MSTMTMVTRRRVMAGALALGPAGAITATGDVTGSGAFGVDGPGTVILDSPTVTYGGGTLISNGTLQLNNSFPPSGAIANHGMLAVGVSGTLANNISGVGGVSVLNVAAGAPQSSRVVSTATAVEPLTNPGTTSVQTRRWPTIACW